MHKAPALALLIVIAQGLAPAADVEICAGCAADPADALLFVSWARAAEKRFKVGH